jgi:integrase
VVSARLGHSSIRTTQDIYAHMIHGQDDEAAERWDEYQKRNQPSAGIPPQKGQVQ